MSKGTRAVECCDRSTHLRGWCYTHYTRWRKNGDPGGPIRRWVRNEGLCAVDDCLRLAEQRGWCMTHYVRWHQGRPLEGPIHPFNRRGDDITYSGMHMRLKRERGLASEHECVDCSAEASEWSYSNADPNEVRDGLTGLFYSTDPDHYFPRCKPCHRRLDLSVAS